MIRVEDFTELPVGRLVPLEGKVERCPRCGRNGIEEHPACRDAYFLHVQASRILPDGMWDEAIDRCPLEPPTAN